MGRGESKNTTLKAIGPLVERETFKRTARAALLGILLAQRFSAVPEETTCAAGRHADEALNDTPRASGSYLCGPPDSSPASRNQLCSTRKESYFLTQLFSLFF